MDSGVHVSGKPFVVGLTGGIGSGKSAVADALGRMGATVVDTDVIAHQLTTPGGAAIPAISEAFGPEYIDAAGAMDRRRMRDRVFQNAGERKRLEQILHPMIREENDRQIAGASGTYVVMVVPLLVEAVEYQKRSTRILVVDCQESTQVRRVMQRSGLSEDEVRRIMATQTTRAARLAVADDVIENESTLQWLQDAAARLDERYRTLARA